RTIRPMAACQEPAALAAVKATMALSPIPLASASGKLATTPMRMQQIPAANAVQAMAGWNGTPAEARMRGLTKRMYAMVRNVAIAPRSSRAMVVWRWRSWKKAETVMAVGKRIRGWRMEDGGWHQ